MQHIGERAEDALKRHWGPGEMDDVVDELIPAALGLRGWAGWVRKRVLGPRRFSARWLDQHWLPE